MHNSMVVPGRRRGSGAGFGRRAAGAAALWATLALSGCTVYESYVVTETRTSPSRPVEVARAGEAGSFERIATAGADVAAAIIAPAAVVAKAAVFSAADVEMNRARERRTLKASRWLSTGESGFPAAAPRTAGSFGEAGVELAGGGESGGGEAGCCP